MDYIELRHVPKKRRREIEDCLSCLPHGYDFDKSGPLTMPVRTHSPKGAELERMITEGVPEKSPINVVRFMRKRLTGPDGLKYDCFVADGNIICDSLRAQPHTPGKTI